MSAVPLFGHHPGHHRRPAPDRAPSPLRRRLAALRADAWHYLRAGAWALPPAPYDPARPVVVGLSEQDAGPGVEPGTAAGEAPGPAEPGAVPAACQLAAERAQPAGRAGTTWDEPLPRLPGTHPYPLPTWMPRRLGDGFVALGPDGCELIPRDPFSRRAPETSADLRALPIVPRYLDAMPGGTE